MPDRNFFHYQGPKTLSEIAQISGAALHSLADPDFVVHDLAPLSMAQKGELSFLDNVKYRSDFANTSAGACICDKKMVEFAPQGIHLLITPTPYKAYALTAQAFYPDTMPDAAISSGAFIDPSAQIGKSCVIEPGAVIGAHVKLGNHVWIEAGAVIGAHVEIGDHSRIGPCASVSHAILHDYVRLYPGVRVGQDGFGFAIDPSGHVKVPQLGRVIIQSHVEIGANTTIDRGAGPDTVIGAGTWIDNLVQIGHNVKIGKGCVIVAQVGISGSTVLDDYVVLGGQVGVAGHLHIGKGARVGAQSGVMRDIPPGQEQLGSPAIPFKQEMRRIAMLNRLINKAKKD